MQNIFSDPLRIVRFSTFRKGISETENPSYHSESEDFEAKLDRLCRQITDEFTKRRLAERNRNAAAKKGASTSESRGEKPSKAIGLKPLQWLKPVCYQLIVSFLDDELFEHLEARHRRLGRYSKNPKAERDIFSSGIMAIFAHVQQKKDAAFLTETERSRLARQMWFAFRHFIPAPLINGFNEQYPFHAPNRSFSDDHLAPELADWIVERFALEVIRDVDLTSYRGVYPDDIRSEFNRVCGKVQALNHLIWRGKRDEKADDDNWVSDINDRNGQNRLADDDR